MRVVISGMGALTPIGAGLEEFAAGLREGRDGLGPIRRFDVSRHRSRVAAEVAWEKGDGSPYSRASEMALEVTGSAVADAGLEPRHLASRRVGVILASNQGGMPTDAEAYRETTFPYRRGPAAGELAVRMLDAAPASTLDLLMGRFEGDALALNLLTACSAGLHALGLAAQAVRSGVAEVVLVTGVEVLVEFTLAGFGVLRALSPGGAPRPFDRRRDGTALGEGAAALVIEDEETVAARGGRVWAEVAGYGASTDAYHMTRPRADGPARAMAGALADVGRDEVSWIKAHGTGTPQNDEVEAQAVHQVFGADAPRLPVTSIKSMLGHSLGASGVVEAVGAVLALQGGFIPPTRNFEEPDPELRLDVVGGAARESAAACVLVNSFGFGGNNASIALRGAAN